MAVVNAAGQDGLIGDAALSRLKGGLQQHGLRVVWTKRQSRAHGVGGPNEVLGKAAIRLGIVCSAGILEVSVVTGDVPLLLPIKMLRSLQSLIDFEKKFMCLRTLNQSVVARREQWAHRNWCFELWSAGVQMSSRSSTRWAQ